MGGFPNGNGGSGIYATGLSTDKSLKYNQNSVAPHVKANISNPPIKKIKIKTVAGVLVLANYCGVTGFEPVTLPM